MIKIDLIDISIQARPYDDQSDVREFGRTLKFQNGLNLVVGDNTSGKTTIVRSLFYCLGLEELIDGKSGSRSLDKSVKENFRYTKDPEIGEKEWYINSSFVVVQLSNHHGQVLTIKRNIKSEDQRDNVLSVWEEAYSSDLDDTLRREYYIHRPDDHNPDFGTGFYALLSKFGEIPIIDVPGRNTDTGTKLYLQTIFGLTFIEQTRGWSDFFANIRPFNIISPKQRVIEYAMNYAMDSDMATANTLKEKKKKLEEEWEQTVSKLENYLAYNRLFANNLSSRIEKQSVPIDEVRIGVRDEGMDILNYKDKLTNRIAEIEKKAESVVEPSYDQGYKEALSRYQTHKKSYEEFCLHLADEKRKLESIRVQVESIEKEIKRYRSLQNVNNIVSNLDVRQCPTCHQLLPLSEATFVISHEQMENSLHVFDMQRRFLKPMEEKMEASIKKQEMNKLYLENQLSLEFESLKSIASDNQINLNPLTVDEQYELVHSRSRLALMDSISAAIERSKVSLQVIKENYDSTCDKLAKQKANKKENTPIESQLNQFKALLQRFGYSSNPINNVFLSAEKNTYQYLPVVEQGDFSAEIRSDSSASDFIRSIWAYYITLLVDGEKHPGFLVMDEPCQHSMKEDSLKHLFEVCSAITDKQIILFCSSQPHTEERDEKERNGEQYEKNIIESIVQNMNRVSLNYLVVDPKSIIEKVTN